MGLGIFFLRKSFFSAQQATGLFVCFFCYLMAEFVCVFVLHDFFCRLKDVLDFFFGI